MRLLILILFLGTIGQCYAGTFDMDTVDNWQIYNGTALVVAGPFGTNQGTIKKVNLKALTIQYNHDVSYIDDFEVSIQITDENGNNQLTKTIRTNSGTRVTIEKRELERMQFKQITIRIKEKRENGSDRILGLIKFE